MQYFNLFSKEDMCRRDDYHYGQKLILDMKVQFIKDGGDPVDFPAYLKEAGVTVDGEFIVMSDEFALMARLKFEKYKSV